tara:strand:- start:22 stop:207 length:186 start_codon:yes stop_codon:yes gene_type:complete
MINEDEEYGDLPFHLAWEAIIRKELNTAETLSERVICRKELIKVRKTIRKLDKKESDIWEN